MPNDPKTNTRDILGSTKIIVPSPQRLKLMCNNLNGNTCETLCLFWPKTQLQAIGKKVIKTFELTLASTNGMQKKSDVNTSEILGPRKKKSCVSFSYDKTHRFQLKTNSQKYSLTIKQHAQRS